MHTQGMAYTFGNIFGFFNFTYLTQLLSMLYCIWIYQALFVSSCINWCCLALQPMYS